MIKISWCRQWICMLVLASGLQPTKSPWDTYRSKKSMYALLLLLSTAYHGDCGMHEAQCSQKLLACDSRASQRFELTDSTYYCASSGGLRGVSWTFRTYRCLILQSMHIPSDICKAGFGECQTQMHLSGYIQCLPWVDLLVLLIVIFIAVVKHVAPAFQSSLCLPQKEFLPDVSDLMNVMLMHTNGTPFVFWRPRNVNGQMCTQKTHA